MNPSKIYHHKIKNGVFVIAEIGKNFIQTEEERPVSEYLENAKALVRAADEAGADAVKFQTHTVEDEQLPIDVVSPHFKGSDRYSWVSRNTKSTPLEQFWQPLKQLCDDLGVIFFSTPMSRKAAELLDDLGVGLWKIGSGDILDFVMLDFIASTKKPVILATGMSTLEELDLAVTFLKKREVDLTILHCVSRYPCPPEELNLTTIQMLKERYRTDVGFSDHSIVIDAALAAVQLGAQVIEKHFSFSRDLWGSDHKASITPEEMKALTSKAKLIKEGQSVDLDQAMVKKALGSWEKVLEDEEAVFRPYFRKSLMAGYDIAAGTIIKPEMIYAMRPQAYAGGLNSEEYEKILGKEIIQDLKKYDPITWKILR